jgi:CRP-like cAMP-binding protein
MPTRNKLLDRLPTEEWQAISASLQEVDLPFKKTLYAPNESISHVYFVTKGVVSMVNEPAPGEIVEFATIGPEGMVGFPVLLGARSMPSTSIVQIPGAALRASVADLQRATLKAHSLRGLLLLYTMALLNQIAQVTSCNRLHEVEQRCARWLLQTHDRVKSDSFPLTQEFLSQMLGVHRPTVSIAAGMLQKAGLITYTRGVITVTDRKGLESAACNCYRLIADEYDRLLNGPLAEPRAEAEREEESAELSPFPKRSR